ncbi:MAG TPA: site-specific integrase [Gemmataceae bacterium]|nr:site-specific integrase [Gemmataceae bacterium]
MPRKSAAPAGHTGRTDSGNTRDVKVERIGPITIYKRGRTYYLYYRQDGLTQRQKIDGNLAAARATAHKVGEALAQDRVSPLTFTRTSPQTFVAGYLDAVAGVQRLALRTRDRYKAALDRLLDFCTHADVKTIDAIDLARVEDFVKWLRGQTRARNGSPYGSRAHYRVGGIKFVLSTCRTAFNWAARRRMLPPYHDNPFKLFPIDKLKDPTEEKTAGRVFTPEQERAFFAACDAWQRRVFGVLATYGLRVAELTHLLVEDVNLAAEVFTIRPKPWLMWNVKTGRERQLPLTPETRAMFAEAIGERRAGFVFVGAGFADGTKKLPTFATPAAFRAAVERAITDLAVANPQAGERDRKRAVVAFCRAAGQAPEKAVREEFLRVTKQIGCPEYTRVHDLRHLFSSRAQAAGVNPILVQDMLGHTTLDMTRRYTHLGLDSKRDALRKIIPVDGEPSDTRT